MKRIIALYLNFYKMVDIILLVKGILYKFLDLKVFYKIAPMCYN